MKSMRRKDREISPQAAIEILHAAEYGVLSSVDKNGQPSGQSLGIL
jgi:hypothetical protein